MSEVESALARVQAEQSKVKDDLQRTLARARALADDNPARVGLAAAYRAWADLRAREVDGEDLQDADVGSLLRTIYRYQDELGIDAANRLYADTLTAHRAVTRRCPVDGVRDGPEHAACLTVPPAPAPPGQSELW